MNTIINQEEIDELIFIRDLILNTDFGQPVEANISRYHHMIHIDFRGLIGRTLIPGGRIEFSKSIFYIGRHPYGTNKYPITDFRQIISTLVMQDIVDK